MTTTEPNTTEWQYTTDRVILIPYISKDSVLAPDILVRLWAMVERDHLMSVVFPGMDMDLNRFVSYLSQMPLLIGVVKPPVQAPEGVLKNQICGFAWLYGVEGEKDVRKAMAGFCFFKPYWRMPEVRHLARLGLKWWIEELKIGVLFGTILASNPIACAFARKFGFKKVARVPNFFTLPGRYEDALLVTLTREQYFETLGRGRD